VTATATAGVPAAADVTRAEICVLACAEAWRGDGEIFASPTGTIPTIGARLARASFEPDLLLSDGEALFVAGTWPVGQAPDGPVEGGIWYRSVFDIAWAGKRHVMMGPVQIDRFGNANLSAIGDLARPTRQLLGMRGAPGNTVNHRTSYWLPRHTARAFVPRVDIVAGVGYDRAAAAGPAATRFHELRRVVTNLAVLDFATPDHSMRLASVHPGVTVAEVLAHTGFELAIDGEVPQTSTPTAEQLQLIREVIDPRSTRQREVPE
jgi:acyl CoA:acetate/3-ketoacid CoA transferase beta subunit